MSMVKELSVSLKDFLPEAARQVQLKSGLSTAISTRLCDALSGYSEKHAIPLSEALARLQHEIHYS
jgi:hypothetical protein